MHTESEKSGFINDGRSWLADRRSKPRIYDPFPALIKGLDRDGKLFEVKTVLDNLSFGGFHVRLMPCVETGAKLFLLIRLSSNANGQAPCIAINAKVLRVVELPGSVCGTAATITKHRYLEDGPSTMQRIWSPLVQSF